MDVEPSAEIHATPLRSALIKLLAEKPTLNNTNKHSGQVWANLKEQRVTCLLNHVRQMSKGNLGVAAAKLKRAEYMQLQTTLKKVKLEDVLEMTSASRRPLEKETSTTTVPYEETNHKKKKDRKQ